MEPEQTESVQKLTFDALLTLTSAAVKDIDKAESPKRLKSVEAAKHKQSDSKCDNDRARKSPVHSHCSAASELVIRTTDATVDSNEQLNLSNVSKSSSGSKGSRSSSTFLTGQAKKLRVSAKKLREIKSPFEEPTAVTVSNGGSLGFFQLLDNGSFLSSLASDQPSGSKPATNDNTLVADGELVDFDGKCEKSVARPLKDELVTDTERDQAQGRQTGDIYVNVVKHHNVRKHTTEHNHSFLVERHKSDPDVSVFSSVTSPRADGTKSVGRIGHEELEIFGLDSGYQTKQLPVRALYASHTPADLKSQNGHGSVDDDGTQHHT